MGRHARLGPFWSPRLRCSSKRAAPRSDASSGSVGRPGRPGVRRACSTASLRDSNGVHMHGIPSPRPLRAWWAPGGVSVQHGSWLHGRRRRRRRRRRAPRLPTGCDCRAGGQRLVGYGAAARAVFVGRASEPTENSELRARRPDWEPACGQGECGPSPSLRLAATQHQQHGRWYCERQVDATAQTQRTARTARLRRRRRRPAAANTGA